MAEEETETSPVGEQHPALAGEPELEVAQRSADGSEGKTFTKTFVMSGPVADDSPQHGNNSLRVLEEALQRGLHPKGEASLVESRTSEPDRRGRVVTACTYSVPAEPAVTDTEAHTTRTPSFEVRVTGRHAPQRADA